MEPTKNVSACGFFLKLAGHPSRACGLSATSSLFPFALINYRMQKKCSADGRTADVRNHIAGLVQFFTALLRAADNAVMASLGLPSRTLV